MQIASSGAYHSCTAILQNKTYYIYICNEAVHDVNAQSTLRLDAVVIKWTSSICKSYHTIQTSMGAHIETIDKQVRPRRKLLLLRRGHTLKRRIHVLFADGGSQGWKSACDACQHDQWIVRSHDALAALQAQL